MKEKKRSSFSLTTFYILSLSFILIGIVYYAIFRPPVIVYNWLNLEPYTINIISDRYFGWFPSFIYVFSFSLLTRLILQKRYPMISVSFWVIINLSFGDVLALFAGGVTALKIMGW